MQVRENVENFRNTVFFQRFGAPEGWKSRLAKAAGAKPSGQLRDQKLHAIVARRRFSKSKWSKHPIVGALLEVPMWKKVQAFVARSKSKY